MPRGVPANGKRAVQKKSVKRLDRARQEQVRAQIRTTALLNRLQDFALGLKTKGRNGQYQKVEMSNAQIRAALGVLAKSLPDLHSGEVLHTRDTTDPAVLIMELKGLLKKIGMEDELMQRLTKAIGGPIVERVEPKAIESEQTGSYSDQDGVGHADSDG